jgi:hypothetical protein
MMMFGFFTVSLMKHTCGKPSIGYLLAGFGPCKVLSLVAMIE